MGLSIVHTLALQGITAIPVAVEADVAPGLPKFHIVGLPDAALHEARQRIKPAITNSGFTFPLGLLTINLAPADLPKQGPSFDVPMALAILSALGYFDASDVLRDCLAIGEVALDGNLRPVRGGIVYAQAAKHAGAKALIVPQENAEEAACVPDILIIPVRSLSDLVSYLSQGVLPPPASATRTRPQSTPRNTQGTLLEDIKGQHLAKRALILAIAGRHNTLFIGPPGTGKTMLAKAGHQLLPPLTLEESLETTSLYSLAGQLPPGALVAEAPFRAPHHTASAPAIVGGGSNPRPGEISLAHHGLLFLDELPEFSPHVRESLREPLEENAITIARANAHCRYPSRFLLIAAMNPCPCGYAGDLEKPCQCPPRVRDAYRRRLSGPLLDRLDLFVTVPRVPAADLLETTPDTALTTNEARHAIVRCRAELIARHGAISGDLPGPRLHTILRQKSTPDARALVLEAIRARHLSPRTLTRLIRVMITIAAWEQSATITAAHVLEALSFRSRL